MNTELRRLQDRPFQLLAALAGELRASRPETGVASGGEDAWIGLGFRLKDRWFVTPRADVREILRPVPYTRVPGARPWLAGVANVRGNLLPLIDLRRFAGLAPTTVTRSSRLLVFSDDRVPAGFMVDEVGGFRRFGVADQRHELVRDETSWAAPYLLGAFVREGQEWSVFSLLKLVHGPDFQNAGQ